MNNNNRLVGEQDLNPLSGSFRPINSNGPTPMNGGIGGNQVGPNNPIFNPNIPYSAPPIRPQILPGSRFDPINPTIGPFGGGGNGGGNTSSSFGNINPSHHKPPQFEDEDF
ncbi:predicted protein [Naegleria gruberi]|uniref:Predicted protein n=1 Tax=Naegleria gruberi TaxID=5762 RepID=D2VAW2_NAEGR|nr:uncharacterized protein NAEGRDRAFT_65998 [Naegleria gruberi]EFC46019.1 predicted protein [Naegleria gruberi]|eukprot:XP_002678763.1 predicted protein [Naegleria gruberi strain NEG-M]